MVLPNHIEQAERIGMPEDKVEVHRCRQCDAKVIEWNDKCDECKKECCPECWVWIPDIGFKFCCESCARTRLLKLLAAAEMNDKPVTEHPDVQRLIGQVVELQAEIKELKIDVAHEIDMGCQAHIAVGQLQAENDKMKNDIRIMVEKAADKNLAGYRELGAKLAAMESTNEELQAENKRLKEALEPFANFACDDWKTHKCFNCIAKQALEENKKAEVKP